MVKNPYGLRNNDPTDWVSVYEVDKSDGDQYFCADCAVQPSDARKHWFFRHEVLSDCEGSRETAIHQMAKRILVEERKIMLPYLEIKPEPEVYREYKYHEGIKPYRLGERKLFRFDTVQDEVWDNGRKPDIVALFGGRKLFIEIVVTHDIDEKKLSWIRERNISTLRVCLGGLPYTSTKIDVKRCLMTGWRGEINIVKWVHHAKKQEHQQQANEFYIRKVKEKGLEPKALAKPEPPSQPKPRIPRQGTLFPQR
jgi:hypothetical protein